MPTVIIGSALDIVEHCAVPRFLFVDFPLGNPCGKPWDHPMQQRIVRQGVFEVRCDSAFGDVVRACAEATSSRPETWINPAIERLVGELYRMGFAHSVECWREDRLVGGLYGVSLGGAFFGESMFSREKDASKVALVHLVMRLKQGGFALLDTQFTTTHLSQFGVREIARDAYRERLSQAISVPAKFPRHKIAMREVEAFLAATV